MAFGAAGDRQLAYEAGRITATEARAIGVHVNFAPVVDVNDNPRNPVINTRSFGEDQTRVGELAVAYVAGLQAGGMLATVKHSPRPRQHGRRLASGSTDHHPLPRAARPRGASPVPRGDRGRR